MNPEEIEKLDGIALMSLVYGSRWLSMWLSGHPFETKSGNDINMDEKYWELCRDGAWRPRQ